MSRLGPLPHAPAWAAVVLLSWFAACGGSNSAPNRLDGASDGPPDARDARGVIDAAADAPEDAPDAISVDTAVEAAPEAGDAPADGSGDAAAEAGGDVGTDADAAGGEVAGDASDAQEAGIDVPLGCVPACDLGNRRCGVGGGVQICQGDSMGCPAWAAASACPAGQNCRAGGLCGCDSTCSAAEVGSYCKDPKTLATCAPSGGCYQSSSAVTCMGAKTCQGTPGAALCACPAAGTTLGAGCTPGAASVCDGRHILTCVGDPAGSGCFVWGSVRDCGTDPAGPLVCGQSSGSPACQCAGASGTDVFVDPVAGNDSSTLVPTGADAPAACRFRTLGRAVAATTASRNRVVAKSATASAASPATFAAEAFPLVVPPGVTVTTADAAPTPANYLIVFANPTAPAAVTLSGGSGLSGFTIQNPGAGNQSASAVRCSSGAVGLAGLVLVGGPAAGAKQAIGLAVGNTTADTCTATASAVRVQAFDIGVRVASSTATPVSLLDSDLENNDTGLWIAGGPVTASRLTISRSTAGAAGNGVLLEASAAIEPSLTATDLVVLAMQARGIDVAAPAGLARAQLHLTNGRIEASASDGVRFRGGVMTATGTTISNSGTGASQSQGVHVLGGTVALRGVTVSGNSGRGLHVEGGTATVDQGSRVAGNGKGSGSAGVRLSAGSLVLGNAFNDAVDVDDSGAAGVEVAPASGTGTGHALTMTNAVVRRNAGSGLTVAFAGTSAGTVSVTGGEIHSNASQGVEINRSPAPAGGGQAVTLDRVAIHGNGSTGTTGRGVSVVGNGNASVMIRNCTVRNNRAYGILVQQSGGTTTTSLQSNDVHGNNTGAGHAVGGILFATTSTLASFTGNKLHSNAGDQLGFEAAPPGGSWNIGASDCNAGPNQIYCYGVGNVGLRTAGGTYTVNAQRTSWVSASPGTGGATPDLRVLGNQTVNVTPACTAVGPTCP